MPYDENGETRGCPLCLCDSNIYSHDGVAVNCVRCGDYTASREPLDDFRAENPSDKKRALASFLIRKIQSAGRDRALTSEDFFAQVRSRSLPSPAECMDNFLLHISQGLDGSPGSDFEINFDEPRLLSELGIVSSRDAAWLVDALKNAGLIAGAFGMSSADVRLTPAGWLRHDELHSAQIASRYAFFARQFNNADLDQAFVRCLKSAVEDTGYELRTVTQRAGLVDAIIEDEIRRCRFVIADLSDDNAGAYWEAGFAEGLGKDVIYICKEKDGEKEKKTHFDADHRHTVRWDLTSLDETGKRLRAVIRNTLLGDAKQSDG